MHPDIELERIKTIKGKTVAEISYSGQPRQFSIAGLLDTGEDILAVLKKDYQTVQEMQLIHAGLAKSLFHVWNIALERMRHGRWDNNQMQVNRIYYHNRKIFFKWQGSRGWQESIFNDEILGQYQLEIWRELDDEESTFLATRLPGLNEEEMNDEFIKDIVNRK